MKKGPFEVKNSKIVYKNPWITVSEDEVIRPDGSNGIFGTITYGEGVCILPIDSEKNAYLIKEFMYAIDRYDFELPSGGIEENERPIEAARRELFEETGLKSEKFISLGVANPLTMIVKSPFHMFLALDCKIESKPEKGIDVKKVSWNEMLKMIESGEISHSGTLSAVLKAKMYFESEKSF